ncbi:MAG: hypothetical protein HY336_01985 [Candidatus Doudnabacteria bacterium]|nr:hypothetical protein [Candidatus Doudnabacteria bacterium]
MKYFIGLILIFSIIFAPVLSLAETSAVPNECGIQENQVQALGDAEGEPVSIQEPQVGSETGVVSDTPAEIPASPTGQELSQEPIQAPDASLTPAEEQPLIQEPVEETVPEEIPSQEPVIQPEQTIVDCMVIENENLADILNNTEVGAASGGNQISASNESENDVSVNQAAIETGEINVYANVVNIVNSTQFNSKITQITEEFNNLAADLVFNQMETEPAEISRDLLAGLCGEDVLCQSVTTFKLSNKNIAKVENNVQVEGDSGNNGIAGVEGEATIQTGSVNALVNILNIVNANLINSRWTIATFNIFGDFKGDLVLPSELYFQGFGSGGGQSNYQINQSNKIVLDIANDNYALLTNDVQSTAQSGDNTITGETAQDTLVETGDSVSVVNTQNFLNTTLINQNWFLGIVNTVGEWTGGVYSLPDEVQMTQTPLGMTFFSTSSNDAELNSQFEDLMSEVAEGKEVVIEIENSNEAEINNQIQIDANSGNNEIVGANLANSRIITGQTLALANIFNFANLNLINSNLYLSFTNIFGPWDGNVVFGYPDLAVEHSMLEEFLPIEKGAVVNFRVAYRNLAASSMEDSRIFMNFNPDFFEYNQSSLPGAESGSGVIEFNMGKLPPKMEGEFFVQMALARDLRYSEDTETITQISGTGPEKELGNNRFAAFSTTGTRPHNPPPPVQIQEASSSKVSTMKNVLISKTNDSAGKTLKIGDQVIFTIKIKNNNESNLQDVVIKDTLKGPDDQVVSIENYGLGDVFPQEEITYAYTLVITAEVSPGVYSNAVFLEGVSSNGEKETSSEATSTFQIAEREATVAPIPVVSNDNLIVAEQPPAIQKIRPRKNTNPTLGLVLGAVETVNSGLESDIFPSFRLDSNELPEEANPTFNWNLAIFSFWLILSLVLFYFYWRKRKLTKQN